MSSGDGRPVEVRLEAPADFAAIRAVNDSAFGRPEEGQLVDRLRDAGKSLFSLVAVDSTGVVGHILFTGMTMVPDTGLKAAGLAPMAVVPARQRQGVGSWLVREGLERCRLAGLDLVVVIGHPGYYPRFGFVPAGRLGLRCEFEAPAEAFMVLELRAGAMSGYEGLVRYQGEFNDL